MAHGFRKQQVEGSFVRNVPAEKLKEKPQRRVEIQWGKAGLWKPHQNRDWQFDPENTGYISTDKFRNLLQRHGSELDPHKLEVLLALADNNSEGKICYQDFVNLYTVKSNRIRLFALMLVETE
ncbi:hypothetical protein lerEdw1_003734 [Lerista edwardsae]|nr:hypothetical protein lerEdw1_003734 [Lerista edwardsae]